MKLLKKVFVFLIAAVLILGNLPIYAASKPLYAWLESVEFYNNEEFQNKSDDLYEVVAVTFDAERDFDSFTLKEPNRIVIDVKYALYEGRPKTISGGEIVKSIRYAQYEKNVVRIVLDTKGDQDYKIEKEQGIIKIFVGDIKNIMNDTAQSDREVQEDENKDVNREQNRGQEQGSRGGVINRGDSPTKDALNIGFMGKGNVEQVSIFLNNYKGYMVSKLNNPHRVIIDIPNITVPIKQQQLKVDGNQVTSVRYAQFTENTARIVIDTLQECSYKVQENNGKLDILIETPLFKNISYNSSGDRVYLSIQGASLTEGGENLKKFYTEKYSPDGMTYTLSFRSNLVNIPKGVININDEYLESITIDKSLFSLNTNIIFKAKDKFVFHVMSRPSVKDTAITILKPALNNEKLVVVDAGHGGLAEPGAVYGNLMEKDINLDIALKLNELLKKNNIKTYMIREDDTYVSYYERAHIANKLNASLFLSIHNNALTDKSFDGTMTLYSVNKEESKSFNSLNFANIIQEQLLKFLGTKDRKVRERNDIVVLRLTKMPAALAEVAFMTNSGDRAKLQSDEFKQKAAEALYDAVTASLSKVKK